MFRNYRHDPADPTGRHSFEIHGLDMSVFNALRRVILTDIPTLGSAARRSRPLRSARTPARCTTRSSATASAAADPLQRGGDRLGDRRHVVV